jgi:dynein heavy chain 2, cytosolic
MQWAAVDGEQVVFIIEDFQLLQEAFLQYLNSILSAGNVPGLYTPQEFEPFSNTLRNLALQDAYDGTLHDYFSYS